MRGDEIDNAGPIDDVAPTGDNAGLPQLPRDQTTEMIRPPRKPTKTTTLGTTAAKVGEPVPKAIVDPDTASLGIPPMANYDPREDLGALRKQIDALRRQVSDAAQAAKGGARQAARQTEAAVKLYPISTLVAVAAVAAGFAFAVAALRTAPRSRYHRTLDEIRDLYARIGDRF